MSEEERLVSCEVNQKPVARTELKVDGKEIELNSFVQNFICQTVIGMVKSLRGVDNIETIDLKISKKAKSSQAQ
ncbi:MAG TPA: hypothetical protein ENH34_06015 [Phycisphaerales bacterium]|nr:hypothetical protein [Phycisphaerales bacterium]